MSDIFVHCLFFRLGNTELMLAWIQKTQ